MRIISGIAKGTRLKSPTGLNTRPTADMVKEAVFSIIHQDIPGSIVLDLFSGSGQLGLEALSRGAEYCVFADSDREAFKITKENAELAGFSEKSRILLRDAVSYLKSNKDKFDIAFIDPPYADGLYEKVLTALSPRMSERGKVICEHDIKTDTPDICGDLRKQKSYKYGRKKITVYAIDI